MRVRGRLEEGHSKCGLIYRSKGDMIRRWSYGLTWQCMEPDLVGREENVTFSTTKLGLGNLRHLMKNMQDVEELIEEHQGK